jgi:hypothetical protein
MVATVIAQPRSSLTRHRRGLLSLPPQIYSSAGQGFDQSGLVLPNLYAGMGTRTTLTYRERTYTPARA